MIFMRLKAFAPWIAAHESICSAAFVDADEAGFGAAVVAATAECATFCLFCNHQIRSNINYVDTHLNIA
jgi:hypothetical protein